ncbi:MAG: hypothetical protein KDD53_11770, partial [Bdellovibrionales bacterium]|nr:hypothetical protein [Bdellovibrionales bacterium]
IDLGDRIGPAAQTILANADEILLLTEGSILGTTSLDIKFRQLEMMGANLGSIKVLCTGNTKNLGEVAAQLETTYRLGSAIWGLPAVPSDPLGGRWPGSGKTFYSLARRHTQKIIEEIASVIGVVNIARGLPAPNQEDQAASTTFRSRATTISGRIKPDEPMAA